MNTELIIIGCLVAGACLYLGIKFASSFMGKDQSHSCGHCPQHQADKQGS